MAKRIGFLFFGVTALSLTACSGAGSTPESEKNNYTVTVSSENTTKGTVIGSGIYLYKSSVTIVATANTGYTFEGWYDESNKVSSNASYTFTMPYNDVNYVAKFSTNYYKLKVTSEDVEKGTVTGSGTYAYGSSVTVTATANNGYTFDGWYEGDTCVSTNTAYTFSMPSHDVNLVIKFSSDLDNKTTGDTILFGSYPQSKVTDSTIISNLTSKVGKLPSSSNSQSWTLYNWYISSSNTTKFAWYINLDTNNDGQNDYRGVYFTSYRPMFTWYDSSYSKSRQDDNGYSTSTLYFFKYEPIEWRILNNNEGDCFVMSSKIIDSEQYYYQSSSGTTRSRTDYQGNSGTGIYDNNYQYSDLRTFLNTDFYNSAFNSTEASRVLTTEVDNSASTTTSLTNEYTCGITNDKVFALSFEDVTNYRYGFDSYSSIYDAARELKVTDYAACMGCYVVPKSGSSYDGCGPWLLRSPLYNYSRYVGRVNYNSDLHDGADVTFADHGVVPALHLQ